ncbi:FecCD family ABC transporter permease [Limisalsivibrio acetivorans]|uniref:FecCD family ABC transporter permease n=1 Tax=Limisalsivibrio acetivorans TaxID=1304888 RepID=UPI0003B554EE|nr:iron ABC transporter permease [Limisalsivibrio acetivorans]
MKESVLEGNPSITLSEGYKKQIAARTLFGVVLAALFVLFFMLSLSVGAYSIPLPEVVSALFGRIENEGMAGIIYNIRLPRAFGAAVSGASLGLAGLAMQHLLRNPLASPFTTGISQGSMFGAAFAFIILGAGSAAGGSAYVVTLCAFGGAMVATLLILVLSGYFNMRPESIVLTGIALSAFFGAGTMLLQYFANDTEVAATVHWSFGDLGKLRTGEAFLLLGVLVPALVYYFLSSWNYNAYNWGDDVARSLGVNTFTMKCIGLAAASLLVAATTAFVGIIGFVGLVAPHIVKVFIKGDNRFLVPYSAMFGAVLLLFADVLARKVMTPAILPVGIVTSFAGAPLFIYLLMKKGR